MLPPVLFSFLSFVLQSLPVIAQSCFFYHLVCTSILFLWRVYNESVACYLMVKACLRAYRYFRKLEKISFDSLADWSICFCNFLCCILAACFFFWFLGLISIQGIHENWIKMIELKICEWAMECRKCFDGFRLEFSYQKLHKFVKVIAEALSKEESYVIACLCMK